MRRRGSSCTTRRMGFGPDRDTSCAGARLCSGRAGACSRWAARRRPPRGSAGPGRSSRTWEPAPSPQKRMPSCNGPRAPAPESAPRSMAAWRWRNVPLPEPHLVGLGTGIALDVIVGGRLFSAAWVGHASGWPLVAAGIGLAAWAVAAAGPVDLERPGTVVASGPYAWTRNPMYLGWSLLYVGVALI